MEWTLSDQLKSINMEANEFIDDFPTLLHRLHALPGSENVRQIEDELKAGLLHLNGLLTEVQLALRGLRQTAGKIDGLEQD